MSYFEFKYFRIYVWERRWTWNGQLWRRTLAVHKVFFSLCEKSCYPYIHSCVIIFWNRRVMMLVESEFIYIKFWNLVDILYVERRLKMCVINLSYLDLASRYKPRHSILNEQFRYLSGKICLFNACSFIFSKWHVEYYGIFACRNAVYCFTLCEMHTTSQQL